MESMRVGFMTLLNQEPRAVTNDESILDKP